jgi:hypothetical protein
MGGREKRVFIDDHSKTEKTMKSIWRPITTNASSCEGLSFLSRAILATDFWAVLITLHYVYDKHDFSSVT